MDNFFEDSGYVIIYRIEAEKPSQKILHQAHKNHQFEWYIKDTLTDDALYLGNFRVYADVKKRVFTPKGTKLVTPWGDKTRTDKDSYSVTRCQINITRLFEANYNHDKSEVMIVPKTINARTWIKNHNLTIYLQVRTTQLKSKKRRVNPKEHKRFYNQFSNNKSY